MKCHNDYHYETTLDGKPQYYCESMVNSRLSDIQQPKQPLWQQWLVAHGLIPENSMVAG